MGTFGDKVIRYVVGFFLGFVMALYFAGNIGVVVFYHVAPPATHKSF